MIREQLEKSGLTGTDAIFLGAIGAMDLTTNVIIIQSLADRELLLIPVA